LMKDPPKPPREGKRPRRRFILFGGRSPDPTKQPIPTPPYSNLDFLNEHESRLPLVTRRQSSRLAMTILFEVAELTIGTLPEGKLRDEISAIPRLSWSELEDVLDWLLVEQVDKADPRDKLRRNGMFRELVYTLAGHSIVACLFMGGVPPRSVYKLSYDEPANESVSLSKGALGRSLGLKSERYYVALNEIGASASYHLEIEVPKELEINATNLIGKRYRWFGDLQNKKNSDYVIQQIGSADSGEIYIPKPVGRRVGLAWVKLRARRTGFLAGALAASAFTTALLGLAAYGAPNVVPDNESESATAALLLVPALLTAYVARPGEHAITAKMLRSARYALAFNAMLPAFAVFCLITTRDPVRSLQLGPFETAARALKEFVGSLSELQGDWMVLALASCALSLLFVASNIAPRPHGETVYRPMPKRDDLA